MLIPLLRNMALMNSARSFDGASAAKKDRPPVTAPSSVVDFPKKAAASPGLQTQSAASFNVRSIRWLWPDRFALGKLGLIGGLPDKGKGLISTDRAEGGQSRSELRRAKEFLQEALGNGPVKKSEIEADAKGQDISRITLRRAKTDLGVIANKEKGSSNAPWTWELPPTNRQGAQSGGG
jgi:hypothetical protein